jgi:hypothetical protein
VTWILYDHGQNKRSSNERLLQQLNTYHAARHQIRLDPEARNTDDGLTIYQTLIDPVLSNRHNSPW